MLPKGISMKLSSCGVLYPTKLPNLGDGTWFNGLKWPRKGSVEVPTAGVLRKSKKTRHHAIKKEPLYGVMFSVFWLMLMLRSSEMCKSSNFELPKRTVHVIEAPKYSGHSHPRVLSSQRWNWLGIQRIQKKNAPALCERFVASFALKQRLSRVYALVMLARSSLSCCRSRYDYPFSDAGFVTG